MGGRRRSRQTRLGGPHWSDDLPDRDCLWNLGNEWCPSAWSRVAVKQSHRVTAAQKCGPASVFQSTAYSSRDHKKPEQVSYRRRQGLCPRCKALISAWPITRAYSSDLDSLQRDTSCSSGYSGYHLRAALGKAGVRCAAGQLVPGKTGRRPSKVTE